MLPKSEHGILEDLAAEIGYTATVALVDWFGGVRFRVPVEAREDHVLAKVIGMPALRRLVKLYEGEVGDERKLLVPFDYQRDINRRDRTVAALFASNTKVPVIQQITGLQVRQLQNIRARLEDIGILPMILRQLGVPSEADVFSDLDFCGGYGPHESEDVSEGKPAEKTQGKMPEKIRGMTGGSTGGKMPGKTQG